MSNLNNFNVSADNQEGQPKEQDSNKMVKLEGGEEMSVGDYLKSKFVSSKAMPICVVSLKFKPQRYMGS